MAANPFAKKLYVIVDWISNDKGKVGVDLKWFRSLGVPAVKSYSELPKGEDFQVVNTGYDSIVDEEKALREKGIDIVDKPCPFIRRVRTCLEQADKNYQYVYLCEPSHITIKNFVSIFPSDMLVVQMDNYQEKICKEQVGKPFRIIPYVTFLKSHADGILEFVDKEFPERSNDKMEMSCLWVNSKASPIVEINHLSPDVLTGIRDALLITTSGSTNKSLASLEESLQQRNLRVVRIGSLREYIKYERTHKTEKILLVRSPVPNNAEEPIMAYLSNGIPGALWSAVKRNSTVRRTMICIFTRYLYLRNSIFRKQAKYEAEQVGLLKTKYKVIEIVKE
jgi:hypothetical protein